MNIKILSEHGYDEALLGLSLSHNAAPEDMPRVAQKLAHMDGGHNKFLEAVVVWLDIRAPRYWWQEFDTYRVGVTKQSESTMHTLLNKKEFTHKDFDIHIYDTFIEGLNILLELKEFMFLKAHLPESFLQRRIVCTNYKTLRSVVLQRRTHKLPQWKQFCVHIIENLAHPELLPLEKEV